MKNQRIEPNLHLIKVKHVISNPTRYNSFLFGSSRAGKIDTRKMIDNNKWYNLYYSEGVPLEHLEDIRMILKNKVIIKNIIIGLDDISYLIDPALHQKQYLRKSYINKYRPYFEYFFIRPDFTILSAIMKKHGPYYTKYDEMYDSGFPLVINRDEYINKNQKKHTNDIAFSSPSWPWYYGPKIKPRTDEILTELSEIITFAKNIRSICIYL